MDDMDMDMGSSDCKISMLWNWYTIDACFLSSSWHIKNRGMFAASCIGVMFLVVVLEMSRRIAKEYDQHIARQWRARAAQQAQYLTSSSNGRASQVGEERSRSSNNDAEAQGATTTLTFRYTPLQQLIRAFLHAITFGLAYIIMLLAMYFNGFIILSIIVGAGLGKFLCDWDATRIVVGTQESSGAQGSGNAQWDPSVLTKPSAIDEPTVCCG